MDETRIRLSGHEEQILKAWMRQSGHANASQAARALIRTANARGLLDLPELPGEREWGHLAEALNEAGRRAETDALALAWAIVATVMRDDERTTWIGELHKACMQILTDAHEKPGVNVEDEPSEGVLAG